MVPTKHKQLQKQKLTLVSKLCMFHSGIIGLFHQEFVQCSNNPNMTVYLQHIAQKITFPVITPEILSPNLVDTFSFQYGAFGQQTMYQTYVK